jgi:hypothetical protein
MNNLCAMCHHLMGRISRCGQRLQPSTTDISPGRWMIPIFRSGASADRRKFFALIFKWRRSAETPLRQPELIRPARQRFLELALI